MASGVVALRGAGLIQMCIELYRQHHPDGAVRCACGHSLARCVVRANCARVFAAAGLDARSFDQATCVAVSSYLRFDPSRLALAWPA